MKMNKIPIDSIQKICKKYKVKELYLFGSVVKGEMHPESDVDFLVKFKKMELSNYFSNFLALKVELEKVCGKNVDLIEHQTLKNPILVQSINESKELIYG